MGSTESVLWMEWPSIRNLAINCPSKIRNEEIIELYVPFSCPWSPQESYRYQWEIKSKGNGKCTILNIQFNTFLTADKNKDGEWIPSLSKNEELWDVQSTSDFTYSWAHLLLCCSAHPLISSPNRICVKRRIVVNKTTVDAFLSLSLKDKTVRSLNCVTAYVNLIFVIFAF